MSETITSEIKGPNVIWPNNTQGYIVYFQNREFSGSELVGYAERAIETINAIINVCSPPHHGKKLPLALKPPKPTADKSSPYNTHRLYDSDTQAGLALVETTYHLTNAAQASGHLDEAGLGRVVYEGLFGAQPIYFVETYDYDENGRYMKWEVGDDRPPAELGEKIRQPNNFAMDTNKLIGLYALQKKDIDIITSEGGIALLKTTVRQRPN